MHTYGRVIIVVSWDGASDSLDLIERDVPPAFETVIFNYSGNANTPRNPALYSHIISAKTECKGEIFARVTEYLRDAAVRCTYVALFDDDLSVRVSDINRALEIADENQFDSFAMSVAPGSYFSQKRFNQQAGKTFRRLPWVEVMMPFYRQAIFEAGYEFYCTSISSYGIDQYLMPYLHRVLGMDNVATIDAVSAKHLRPVTSDDKVFANGLTAHQERAVMRRKCLDTIAQRHPEWVGSYWYYATYAPINGPLKFLGLYAFAPLHLAIRLLSRFKATERVSPV